MPIITLSFDNQINSSAQVGDTAWVSTVAAGIVYGEPEKLGKITNIQSGSIEVDASDTVTIDDSGNYFLLFSKPIEVNESGLKGYYANVTFENSSKTYAELFAISSEVVPSSK